MVVVDLGARKACFWAGVTFVRLSCEKKKRVIIPWIFKLSFILLDGLFRLGDGSSSAGLKVRLEQEEKGV